jgi:CDP-4-dehydro-6-deoxyglucose reductase/ferredoxin-NAD(P)+ reductase (naphthalene dioxygenase ferredoxin-specific)
MANIKIEQWHAPLENCKGTILDAALRDGIPYPHSCRSGECGQCKTRLLSGKVKHYPYLKEALSDAERSEDLILACRAQPTTDVEIAWLGADELPESFPERRVVATVVGLERAAHNVTRLRLEVPDRPLGFAAGQYARLSVSNLPARSFSMANRPDEALLEFHIRHVPDGLVSGYVAGQMALGEKVQLEGPFGSACLRENHGGPIVAVAGGTGLAPVMSIVRTALSRMPARPVHLYFGVQDEADIYAERELSELAAANSQVRVHIVLSAPAKPTARRTGFVHQALEEDLADVAGYKVYSAGPPPMVTALTATALARGASRADIHADPFSAAPQPDTSSNKGLPGYIARLFGAMSSGPRRPIGRPNRAAAGNVSQPGFRSP